MPQTGVFDVRRDSKVQPNKQMLNRNYRDHQRRQQMDGWMDGVLWHFEHTEKPITVTM